MNKLCLRIAVAMITSIGLFANSASAANRTVDCDKGQSIQDAVEKGKGSVSVWRIASTLSLLELP